MKPVLLLFALLIVGCLGQPSSNKKEVDYELITPKSGSRKHDEHGLFTLNFHNCLRPGDGNRGTQHTELAEMAAEYMQLRKHQLQFAQHSDDGYDFLTSQITLFLPKNILGFTHHLITNDDEKKKKVKNEFHQNWHKMTDHSLVAEIRKIDAFYNTTLGTDLGEWYIARIFCNDFFKKLNEIIEFDQSHQLYAMAKRFSPDYPKIRDDPKKEAENLENRQKVGCAGMVQAESDGTFKGVTVCVKPREVKSPESSSKAK